MSQGTTGSAPAETGLGAQLRKLVGQSAIYGSADVLPRLVDLALFPVYTRFLSPSEYGGFALVLVFTAAAKIVFRLGLDAGFFRVFYDQKTDDERATLVSSTALFAAAAGTLQLAVVAVGAGPLAWLFSGGGSLPRSWIVLGAADVWLGMFAFVPLNLLRIQNRAGTFSAFSIGRHLLNAAFKVTLVVLGYGVLGILIANVAATALFSLALSPLLRPHLRAAFSLAQVREVLRFGLPKVPHGLMVQAQNLADRPILGAFVSPAEVGLYHVGYTLGTGVKFATSAFEPAWQPFVYSQIGDPEAKRTLSRIVTWAFAAFTGVGLAVAMLGRELVVVLTVPAFYEAASVIPIVTLAYLLHGVFLLGSIGIGIEKRTRYYPLVTAASATTNIAANLVLIPWLGMRGAAWATVLSYGVMALLGVLLSQRVHPLPLEWGRLARIGTAAAFTYAVALFAPAAVLPGALVKLGLLGLAFPALVVALGTPSDEERSWLRRRLAPRR